MASNIQASTASAPKEASTFASAPLTAYLLSYDARDWSNGITLLDDSKPVDPHCGILSLPYETLDGAQDVGMEWTLKQLQDHLRKYDPPLFTVEEIDAEFDTWRKSSSEQGDIWSYTVSKGDETLVITVAKLVVDGPYASDSTEDGNKGLVAGEGLKKLKK